MAELKPCPFCGGEAEIKAFASQKRFGSVGFYGRCTKCDACGRLELDPVPAIEAWNRRDGGADNAVD